MGSAKPNMNTSEDPTGSRKQPPVARYAAIIGILIGVAIGAGSSAGQRGQNHGPTGTLNTPQPGVSNGPSPRY